MITYEAKTFTIPQLEGISEKGIEVHLGLYQGYVKHVNVLQQQLHELEYEADKNAYAIAEVRRRLGFEFDGMKNHELYFAQFEGGAQPLPAGDLATLVTEQFESYDRFEAQIRAIAMTRGIGWTMVTRDRSNGKLLCTWVDDHHVGMLTGVDIILALDMWEHAYMVDYVPGEKKAYVDAFFKNLNWEVIAKRI